MESALDEGVFTEPNERKSRRRRRLAHALGALGILLTLGLNWLAFGKRAVALLAVPAPTTPAPSRPTIPAYASASASASASVETPATPDPRTPPLPEAEAERAPVPATPASVPPPAKIPPPATIHRRVEPPLTAQEIQVRKERYARWLSDQGLKGGDALERTETSKE